MPGWEFDRLVPYLVGAGFRTIRPDLFGHGSSDRPKAIYDMALFDRQIDELMAALSLQQPVHLLGHSLGGALCARFAARHPLKVSRLILAAPLLNFRSTSAALKLLDIPLLGELLMLTYVLPMLQYRRTHRYRFIAGADFPELFRAQVARPGFGRALLSLLRNGALADQTDAYRLLATQGIPSLVMRGDLDEIYSAEQHDQLFGLLPDARFADIAGTTHSFLLTDPDLVAPTLIDFLHAPDLD